MTAYNDINVAVELRNAYATPAQLGDDVRICFVTQKYRIASNWSWLPNIGPLDIEIIC